MWKEKEERVFFWSTLSKDTSFCLAISIETKGFEVAGDRSVAGF